MVRQRVQPVKLVGRAELRNLTDLRKEIFSNTSAPREPLRLTLPLSFHKLMFWVRAVNLNL